jgi:hypothetical protein
MDKPKRTCGTCTKCCEGWLPGDALGHTFFEGKPCHFIAIGTGCTVYAKRPEDPCKSYKCGWLTNQDIPEWMKPNEVNAIVDFRELEGVKYVNVSEAGDVLESRVLSWLIQFAIKNNINLLWTIQGGSNWIGSEDFSLLMSKKYSIRK